MIYPIATHKFTLKRQTAILLASTTASASLSLTRQPSSASCIQVKVSGGTAGSGSVTVSGVSGGSSTSEELTFSKNGVKATLSTFTSVSGLTTSSLADEATPPSLEVKAVSKDGQPNTLTFDVAASRPCVLDFKGKGDWKAEKSGTHETQNAVLLLDFEEAYTPRVGDLAVNDYDVSDVWIVKGVKVMGGQARPQHIELNVSRYES